MEDLASNRRGGGEGALYRPLVEVVHACCSGVEGGRGGGSPTPLSRARI